MCSVTWTNKIAKQMEIAQVTIVLQNELLNAPNFDKGENETVKKYPNNKFII